MGEFSKYPENFTNFLPKCFKSLYDLLKICLQIFRNLSKIIISKFLKNFPKFLGNFQKFSQKLSYFFLQFLGKFPKIIIISFLHLFLVNSSKISLKILQNFRQNISPIFFLDFSTISLNSRISFLKFLKVSET